METSTTMEELAESLLVPKGRDGGGEESSMEDGFYSAAESDNHEGFEDALLATPSLNGEAIPPQQENNTSDTISLTTAAAATTITMIPFLPDRRFLYRILHMPLLPEFDNHHLFHSQFRFLKFVMVTILGIMVTHDIVQTLNWEHRSNLRLSDIWLYEGNLILLDCVAFFCIGRLYENQLPVDHLAWILIAALSALYTSILPNFQFLQHSVTLYEMHCTWPWQLWVFVFGLVLPACLAAGALHVRRAFRQNTLQWKLLELSLTFLLFLTPQVGNPRFEFHHWFAGLLFGMHANYDTWWSRATQAWCWGQYINGLAVWGRDPTLTCAYAYYISHRQHCIGSDVDTDEVTTGDECHWVVQEDPPDWRHCHHS